MSPDRDSRLSPEDSDDDLEEEEAPRSIFSATWFRVVLVLLGVGVIGAVAVPYVLDVVNPPPDTKMATPAPAPGARPMPAPPSVPSAAAPPSEGARTSKAPGPPAVAEAPKSQAPAPAAKKEPAREMAKSEPAEKAAPKTAAPAAKAAPAAPKAAPAPQSGDYFVQVGAFKDAETAKRVAARLREQNYPVVESVTRIGGGAPAAAARPAPRAATPSGPDRYDVIVSGGSSADINTKLAAKGLASEPVGEGVRIRPSLPLRDAVALSKDLGAEGFKVQVRRGGGAASEPAPAPTRTAPAGSDADGQTLYRVRVGGYPDRAAAQAVLRELQEKGFQPFIARGRE